MFTQLSLFDLSGQFDSVSPVVALGHSETQPIAVRSEAPIANDFCEKIESAAKVVEPVRIYGESRRHDSIQPMGDLARLVIARYEMMARRREEMARRKAVNPRKSIRVLSPA